MKGSTITYEMKGSVALLTLDCPHESNAICLPMALDLEQAVGKITDDDEVRVVVVTGSGEAFAVGSDPVIGMEDGQRLPKVAATLARIECPVIGAINGDALGQGLELALACDIRLASDSIKLGLDQIHQGLIPWDGGTQRLPRLVGRGRALAMILLGQVIDADEALRIGLVHAVHPRGSLLEEALGLADRISGYAPIALRYAKEAVGKGMDMTLDQGLRLEQDLTVILQSTEDRAEGISSFLEKRKPKYKGH